MKKIAQGAEAVLLDDGEAIVKHRLAKGYRLPALDLEIRKKRTRREARILRKLQGIVRVPRVLEETEDTLVLEKIEGKQLKKVITPELCEKTGELVGRMHSAQVVHGDLTTSNFLVSSDGIVAIDFGLAYASRKPEDFATDLHVFEEVVTPECMVAFLEGYVKTNAKTKEVLARLEKLKKRGRYKQKARATA